MKISALVLTMALCLSGQPAAAPRPAFEVASIHPSNADEGSYTWTTAKGSLRMENFSLHRMIMTAYRLSEPQISGGPKWINSQRFDLMAKPSGPATTDEMLAMLQTLLADRFKLVFHREKREITGYALVVAKGGLKVQPVEAGTSVTDIGRARIKAKATRCEKFAELLSRVLGAPVKNDTGVDGAYDFSLEWSEDEQNATGPSLFTALQEKLGLKLEARKVSADVLVIDSAELPSDN